MGVGAVPHPAKPVVRCAGGEYLGAGRCGAGDESGKVVLE